MVCKTIVYMFTGNPFVQTPLCLHIVMYNTMNCLLSFIVCNRLHTMHFMWIRQISPYVGVVL